MYFVIVILFRSFTLFTRVVHVGFVLFLMVFCIIVHFFSYFLHHTYKYNLSTMFKKLRVINSDSTTCHCF